ncbi:MAG: hypothetical protein H6741_12150 [Alphaproteobacteria bacterium]|nr:hypothetical protein [Alphaproteobacteria bacterium]
MRPPPEAPDVLGRVARFLAKEVQVEDKAVAFRLKVAAFLVAAVARDIAAGDSLREGQLHALSALLGDAEPPSPANSAALAQAVTQLEARLAEAITRGDMPVDEALPLLRRQLAFELTLSNPRFDLSDSIEPSENT